MFKVGPEYGHCKQAMKEGMLLSLVLNTFLQDIKWLLDSQENFTTVQWCHHSKAEETVLQQSPRLQQAGCSQIAGLEISQSSALAS